MLRDWTSHQDYQKQLCLELLMLSCFDRARMFRMEKTILKFYLLDLDKSYPILSMVYPNIGRPAENQVEILRSLALMLDQDKHSITDWAEEVASDRLLCTIAGFKFGEAPGVGTYYDFIDRLWPESWEVHINRKNSLHPFKEKPRKKLKAGQKMPPKHQGAVKELAELAKDDKLRESRYEIILQKILACVVVDTSAKLGLLGNTEKLSISGDGTAYLSGASHYGTKVCDCKSKGIYKCKCPRKYSDPDATWGWDSYRERYFFGSTLYPVTASDSPNDLPIYLRIAQAQRHDSITTVFALNEVRKMFPQFTITDFIADGAMDNYPTYELCKHWNIKPFIPLNTRTKLNMDKLPAGIIAFDDQNRPICPGTIPYYNWGYCRNKHAVKWRCYFDCKGLDKPCKCSDSSYGRTVYTKVDWDLRIFTPVPRHSEAFKQKLRDRSSSERCNKRIFEDYNIETGKVRSNKHRFMRATLAAINVHLDAWINHTTITLDSLLEAAA